MVYLIISEEEPDDFFYRSVVFYLDEDVESVLFILPGDKNCFAGTKPSKSRRDFSMEVRDKVKWLKDKRLELTVLVNDPTKALLKMKEYMEKWGADNIIFIHDGKTPN